MACPDCPACRADLQAIAERAANARALIAEALTVLATAYVDADMVLDGHAHHAALEQATP